MKQINYTVFVILILLQGCTKSTEGVKIVGNVKNSNQEYVVLFNESLCRGNLNFDGFRSVGNRIDKKGNFTLLSDKLVDASDYRMKVGNKFFHVVLFTGDDIKVSFDLTNPDSTLFALGKGAGKINVLQLPQFKSNLRYDTTYTMNTYKLCVDSVINSQSLFLNAIYNKDVENKILQKAKNKESILKIIRETPLSEKEYTFLKGKISALGINYLGGFLSFLSRQKPNDSLKVDFSNSYFDCFNSAVYKNYKNINYWQFEDCINHILELEYSKSIQHGNPQWTYGNFAIDDYSKYRNWCFNFAKNNFNPETFDAYFASILTDGLSEGNLNKALYDKFIQNCSDKKYVNRVNDFIDLQNNGLNDKAYNLYTLDSLKLDSLLKSYKEKNIYVIIWSSQYAGATIISDLPSIIDFEKENQGDIITLNICIDKAKYQNQWAARIIDNSWKGNHYFLPAENNDSIINEFAAQNIFEYCDGGATYSFISKNGTITNDIEAPITMTKEKLNRLENCVFNN